MRFLVLLLAVSLCACNDAKIAQLEKETKDLRKQLDEAKHVDLSTQEKCAAASQRFLQREYPPDKDTITLTQHNHYNQQYSKCLVLIEWHYYGAGGSKAGSWYMVITLFDAYENGRYAQFSKFTSIGENREPHETMYACEVDDKKCASLEDFNKALQPFLDN